MGASNSKQSCIQYKRPSQVIPGKPNSRRMRRRSSWEIVKDINTFLRTSDSSTIRKQVGNYFTITSTRERIEFAHGEKDSAQKLKWVNTRDFQFSTLLGNGGFGAVYKARRLSTGKDYALKIQPMEVMLRSTKNVGKKVEDETLIHLERTVLASCRGHPFIVRLEYAFHTDLYAILGLEYVPGGTLALLISNSPKRRLPFHLTKIYTIELTLALHFMHCKGIIYRDLKPSNVLVALDGHLKVTDFGLAGAIVKHKKSCHQSIPSDVSNLQLDQDLLVAMSKTKHDEATGNTDDILSDSSTGNEPEMSKQEENGKHNVQWIRRRTVCGTAGYRPPEQVQERFLDYFSRSGYDERADWFSLGVCCFSMLTGHRPFPTKKELLQSDSQRNLVIRAESIAANTNIDIEAAERVMNDAEYRCLMFEVKFPKQFDDEPIAKTFIQSLLARNPDERPRYDGIEGHPWMRDESFDVKKLVNSPIPSWVKDHARLQSMKNECRDGNGNRCDSLRQPQRTLTECIESLCSECFEKYGAQYAESFAIKWSTLAQQNTIQLFQHWNYMSDDVIALEAKASFHNENKKMKKQLSTKSNGVLDCHSLPELQSTSYKRSKIKL